MSKTTDPFILMIVLALIQDIVSSMDPGETLCDYLYCHDCRIINGVPKCFVGDSGPYCPDLYSSYVWQDVVCGSNKILYSTIYHLALDSCQKNEPLTVVDERECSENDPTFIGAAEETQTRVQIFSNSTNENLANEIDQDLLNRAAGSSSIQEELEQMSEAANLGSWDKRSSH